MPSKESRAHRRIGKIIRIPEKGSVRLENSHDARWFVMNIRVLPAMARECNFFSIGRPPRLKGNPGRFVGPIISAFTGFQAAVRMVA